MKYTIGLDLGTTSVGWAVIDTDNNKIADLGVRIFESAENPKDGKSLAEPRRNARSMRRRLARRGSRLNKIKEIFIKEKILSKEDIIRIHSSPNNPYQFRANGLNRILTNSELFIAIYHLAKRRGYKSNRKKILETKDDESKKVLSSIEENKKLLKEKGCLTVGEMFYKELSDNKNDLTFAGIRNKPGSYKHSVSREMLEEELILILNTQKKLGNKIVTDSFIDKFVQYDENNDPIGAFNFQRHYAQGEILKKMVGICTFENKKNGFPEDEMRAAKSTYTFQYFNFLQKLNHTAVDGRPFTNEEKKLLIEKVFTTKTISYGQIRSWLNLPDDQRFNIVYALSRKDVEDKTTGEIEELKNDFEKKQKFPALTHYHEIKNIISGNDEYFWQKIEKDIVVIDTIAEVLTLYKTDKDIKEHLAEIEIDGKKNVFPADVLNGKFEKDKQKKGLLDLSFTKFGHLSLKALRKIIPFLEQGMTYDKAVAAADERYGKNLRTRTYKLQPIDKDDYSITNPVVKRTISQTIKVVNAIIDKYGSPDEVHIELGRELSKNHRDRRDIIKNQTANRTKNENALENIKAKGIIEPSGKDIVKYKLWNEQGCKCAYSGKPIDENRLFEDGYTQIDHIIPFSRSFDDSYNNKVLVLTAENQNKLNKLPYEAFGHNEERWQEFENLISTMNLSYRKKNNLLLKKYVMEELTARTLNDTRFLSKYLKNYIENTLEFAKSDKKRRVITVNGAATAYLRSRWGLNKNRNETDTHHAQDAAVVAVTNSSLINKVAYDAKIGEVRKAFKRNPKTVKPDTESDITTEDIEQAKEKNRFPEPWEGFSYDLVGELKKVFVSRMPRRKTTGKVHDETLRSPKLFSENKSSVRKPLTSITEKMLIENRSTVDPGIYDRLLEQLRAHGGDAKKAFTEPFYKIRRDGTNGPVVRTLKITTDGQKSGMLINDKKALADRGSMIRADVFSKKNNKGEKRYYFSPVYADRNLEEINDDFEFSLYPGDLIKSTKSGIETFWYYKAADVNNGARFDVDKHDRSKNPSTKNGSWRLSIGTLDKLDKYVVDILGNYYLVKKEKRLGFKK